MAFLTLLVSGCSLLPNNSTQYCQDIDVSDINAIAFKAHRASLARIEKSKGNIFRVCGLPSGGVEGYHSSDPDWKEIPADEWGLDFKSKKYNKALVISTNNELLYIHHYYYFDQLVIYSPGHISITLVNRDIVGGDGKPDLNLLLPH